MATLDTFTEEGAATLKARIEKYWADKGRVVDVRVERVGFVACLRSAYYVVRSDMVDGQSTKRVNTR